MKTKEMFRKISFEWGDVDDPYLLIGPGLLNCSLFILVVSFFVFSFVVSFFVVSYEPELFIILLAEVVFCLFCMVFTLVEFLVLLTGSLVSFVRDRCAYIFGRLDKKDESPRL